MVLLTERFWRTQMGARADPIGQTLRLDGEPTTVIGVLPRSPFDGIFVPLAISSFDRSDRSLFVWARLKPAVTIDEAHAEMDAIGRALETEYPDTNRGWTINTRPLQEEFNGPQARLAFGLLLAMAMAVLFIGCVNIANLLLARAVARRGEIAVRMALGAGVWRVARQLLSESAVIAALGAGLSLPVAHWVIALLVTNFPPLESPWIDASLLNLRILGVTATGALVATLTSGLGPAFSARRGSLVIGLHAAGRGGAQRSQRRLMRTLVGVQVTLAVMLLIVAGLLTRSIGALQRLDPGFDVTHLLSP